MKKRIFALLVVILIAASMVSASAACLPQQLANLGGKNNLTITSVLGNTSKACSANASKVLEQLKNYMSTQSGKSCANGACPTGNCANGSCPTGNCANGSCPTTACKNGSCPTGNCANGSCPTQPAKPVTPAPSKPVTPSKPSTPSTPTQPAKPSTPSTPAANNLAYEKQVVDLVNKERAANGLPALTLSSKLSDGARLKSQDMHDKKYFSHTSPTYGSPFDMMNTLGISYRAAGENIAMGYASPQAVVTGWMNSPGHRANILNASFTTIGVGYVADGHYWTQWFTG